MPNENNRKQKRNNEIYAQTLTKKRSLKIQTLTILLGCPPSPAQRTILLSIELDEDDVPYLDELQDKRRQLTVTTRT